MLFITNKIVGGTKKKLRFKASNELSQSLLYCQLHEDETFQEIGSESFMSTLRDNNTREILFYIHGFNNQPYREVFPRARQMTRQLHQAGLFDIEIVPIIWPCDDDYGIIKDYWDDQDSAEESGRFFSRAISKLMAWQTDNQDRPCLKRMHVMAHSMGARVLLKTLSHWAKMFGGNGVPYLFKNIFLMAADISNNALERNAEGRLICSAAQRVLCYHANDDLAMPASKIANVKNGVFTRRIGHTGPESLKDTPENVYAINCDSFNTRFDFPQGHCYFLDQDQQNSPAFQHVVDVLKQPAKTLANRRIVL